jgi:hypothetical protein
MGGNTTLVAAYMYGTLPKQQRKFSSGLGTTTAKGHYNFRAF